MLSEYTVVAFGSAILGAGLRPLFDDFYDYTKHTVQRNWNRTTLRTIVQHIPVYSQWKKRKRQEEIEELVEAAYPGVDSDE